MQLFSFITLILIFILAFYVISNLMTRFLAKQRGTVLKADQFVSKAQESNGQLIDVREKQPFKRHHLKGARNMPALTFSQGKSGLRKDMPIFLYGDTLQAANGVAKQLKKEGADKKQVFLMAGGFRQYVARQNNQRK
ncbi:rhodanese-like domain-containing protein [Fructobacillus sp. M1-13]|uniref:Rhodanese-like domain-containing protein n=1 Tax=Fructobacillus papyriferae TaxID=2713171 RepID=A0ABS5QN62_9LACO|nr:rhodanese-like domain-containing protein [Fructobacillus papyriferae]MBS9334421.1 rhodanese-like domain-containing protein [Fructobacillus papyriferae]MCD2158410.1 rhodanese-like domain-containing protein [Fructobacillus papyriferae]